MKSMEDISNYAVCKRCGALVRYEEKRCPYCGYKMWKNRSVRTLLIILLVIVLAIGGFYIFLNANYGDEMAFYRTYNADADRAESYYKSRCHEYFYDQLLRNPEDYKGKYCRFDGVIFQVFEEGEIVKCLIDVNEDEYSFDLELVCVFINKDTIKSRLLEDDEVSFYGKAQGLYRYESIVGDNKTVPFIFVQYIDRR